MKSDQILLKYLLRAGKQPLSRGWSQWLVCGGKARMCMFCCPAIKLISYTVPHGCGVGLKIKICGGMKIFVSHSTLRLSSIQAFVCHVQTLRRGIACIEAVQQFKVSLPPERPKSKCQFSPHICD
ncbi:hypothetical protein ElyMa_000051500 [Elysia marginata]|uniref:Uncharacterized protein n=1 Tax=Elysia marginata TaxID=1093978 RepID=A0AAV4EFK8_9GAST|nr:hypothetical protein ElyMa_000051500 [Elysia marginata]